MNYLLYIGNKLQFYKMKNIIIFIIGISLLLASCTEEGMRRPWVYFTIKNKTKHDVKLKVFSTKVINNSNVNVDTTFLLPSLNSEIKYLSKEGGFIFSGREDSIYFIFDNKMQIIYRLYDSKSKNIMHLKSWNGGKVEKYKYEYEYNITEEDYKNAVEIK